MGLIIGFGCSALDLREGPAGLRIDIDDEDEGFGCRWSGIERGGI